MVILLVTLRPSHFRGCSEQRSKNRYVIKHLYPCYCLKEIVCLTAYGYYKSGMPCDQLASEEYMFQGGFVNRIDSDSEALGFILGSL